MSAVGIVVNGYLFILFIVYARNHSKNIQSTQGSNNTLLSAHKQTPQPDFLKIRLAEQIFRLTTD